MNIEWSSHAPEINNFGIVVDTSMIVEQGLPVNATVYVVAAFPRDGLFPIEVWTKSLFLTVFTDSNLIIYHGNLTRDVFIFPEEIKTKKFKNGDSSDQLAITFKLMDEIGEKLEDDKYYIRVSACQYQSNISVFEVME